MRTWLLAGAIGALLTGGMASARTVDARHAHQQERIGRGVRSGELTGRETRNLEHQQASIDRQEVRMRDRDGGHLTGRDRAILKYREDRASQNIYRDKHNLCVR